MPEQQEGMRDARGRLRSDHQTLFTDAHPSMTVQSDAHLADIQEILKSFGVTGMGLHLEAVEAQFVDVSEFDDYADVMRHVRVAEVEFMKLPSKIREKFNHNVSEWLDKAHEEPAIEVPETPVVPVVEPVVEPEAATE